MTVQPIHTVNASVYHQVFKNRPKIEDHPELIATGKYATHPLSNIQLADVNYNRLLIKSRSDVSFKGFKIPPVIIGTYNVKIPLEEKIASIFENFNHGDILLVGNDLKSTKNAMKESVGAIKHVIKKAFFIEEKNLASPLAFFKNDNGKKELINLGSEKVLLTKATGSMFYNKGESVPISIGDIFKVKDVPIRIKLSAVQEQAEKRGEKTETLDVVKNLYTKVIPLEKKAQKSIENVNIKILDDLVADGEVLKKKVTLSDVGGQDKAIIQLKKGVLLPLKNPEFYKNRQINRGFILEGGPGTGKTLAAKALANETGMTFFQINARELESKWVGESEQNLRKLFQQAKDTQPSIILFDEMDAIARQRGGQDVYGDKFVNQFLSEMTQLYDDGNNVFVLATTNRAELLDDAIVRSKRFGKVITFDLPQDVKSSKQILDIHTKNRVLGEDYKSEEIAQKLFDIKASGADISQIVEDAHDSAFERLGLFEKMELGTATKEDLALVKLTKDDFLNAIEKFKEQNMAQKRNAKKQRNKIGFLSKEKAVKP